MSALLARPSDSSRLSWPATALRADDRVRVTRTATARGPLMLVVAGSLALHVLVLSSVVVAERSPARMPPHEIAVEVVQEPPPPKPEVAKPEPPKPDLLKPKPTEITKAEVKPPEAKPAAVEPPKTPAPAPAPKSPPPPPPVAQTPPAPSPQETQVAELRKELAALKAEHDTLAQAATTPPLGSGKLDGFAAAALPSVGGSGDPDAEAASYQALVFSELAKAKGIGRQQGKPGTAGVRFEVDDEGKLVSVDVVSPSGIPSLDAEALAIVKRASPFLPPPKGAQRIFMANFNFVPQADR